MPKDTSPDFKRSRVLIVDDEEIVRETLADFLSAEGYEVATATTASALRERLEDRQPDVVLLDLKLPDGDGIDLIPDVKRCWPETEVIMFTGHGTIQLAVEATKAGAFYFLTKPLDPKTLPPLLQRACEKKRLQQEISNLHGIFVSRPMKDIVRDIRRFAPSDASILITGESGTGKEVIADLVRSLSARSQGPLVKVNCAAFPRELIESELFGAVKGAYTGSLSDRDGLFRQAEKGTILLDEISEMPVDTQSKLLRVLQDKEFRPVGGKTVLKADCRVLAATNRKPQEAIRDGKLREDLFYRISTITVHLPPLRERREDILPLAHAFLKRFAAQAGRAISGFTPAAAGALQKYQWPGNVRQLENEVQRAIWVCDGDMVDRTHLSTSGQDNAVDDPQGASNLAGLEAMERKAILEALARNNGNKAAAARELGITRQTLYNKMKAYGLNPEPEPPAKSE